MIEIIGVDINIISYIFRKDSRANLYEPHLVGRLKIIAAQTFAELELMPLQNSWSEKRHQKLRELLQDYVIIEANKEVCLYWAKIQFEARKNGTPVSVGDAWIAATALAYSIPLVTHNYKDFKNISGLQIISEI